MQKTTSIINNEQGTVIIVAIIVLVLLTVIGISATREIWTVRMASMLMVTLPLPSSSRTLPAPSR